MGEKEKRIALLGANNPFFILLDSCTFLPCSSRTRSRRRYCAIFSLTFSSSFYLSVICYYCYPFWHPSLGMRVNSCAKVRRFSTKNKQNTELFALTASFLMLVNTPWSSFSIVNTGIQKVAWNRGHTPSVLLKDRNGKTVWFIMLLTIFSIKNCPRDLSCHIISRNNA